jgi:hypothetical protein
MAVGLFENAFARVDEDDGQIRGGGAGDHVARVLDMARRVGDDEFAARRGEVTVGHVDGDALLPLGAEAVGEQRQVDLALAAAFAQPLDGFELVFKDRLRVVKQASDERAFPVVNRSGRREAK